MESRKEKLSEAILNFLKEGRYKTDLDDAEPLLVAIKEIATSHSDECEASDKECFCFSREADTFLNMASLYADSIRDLVRDVRGSL